MSDGSPSAGTEQCPECEAEAVEGYDRMGYELQQCPGCARWKRPSSDEWRMPEEVPDAE